MTIVNFTPVSALVGGALIGIGSAGMWWLLGRISGVSSILGSVISPGGAVSGWRIAFLAGLLSAGILAASIFSSAVHFQLDAGYGQVILAGLLVGYGTQLGSGCTSGHGVCGISRFSPRSLVATAAFMIAGVLVVYFMRHVLS